MYDEFANAITFQDGRYKVSLPWKNFHEPLPDKYQLWRLVSKPGDVNNLFQDTQYNNNKKQCTRITNDVNK